MGNRNETTMHRQPHDLSSDDGSRDDWTPRRTTFAEETQRVIEEVKAEISRVVRKAFEQAD